MRVKIILFTQNDVSKLDNIFIITLHILITPINRFLRITKGRKLITNNFVAISRKCKLTSSITRIKLIYL